MSKPITITYRAVHMNTPWRKVRGHTSLHNAVYGQTDGAPGLFGYKVRIDYKKHGEPLYVVIWEDDSAHGFVVKKDSSSSDGTRHVEVPVDVLEAYEAKGGASKTELEAHFSPPVSPPTYTAESLQISKEEGDISLNEHFVRERNASLTAAKKADVLRATGRLACEACSFDFAEIYGEFGNGFCEVHHTKPLGLRSGSEITCVEDLSVLCSNCHSIIHRTKPMWSVATLAAHLATQVTHRRRN